jgi:hypothetical protein
MNNPIEDLKLFAERMRKENPYLSILDLSNEELKEKQEKFEKDLLSLKENDKLIITEDGYYIERI